tara:strand:- start:5787 stop:6218 length:432 start_codon:yes stop_codon:yes gene_type:complete
MILKRTVNEGVVNGLYDSTNILASAYDQTTNNLTVTFKNGGKYKYNGVIMKDFTRFELADSQGKVLNSHIKNNYEFEALGKIDTKDILESVAVLEKESLQEFAEVVRAKALDLIAEVDSNLELSDKRIVELESALAVYKGKRK